MITPKEYASESDRWYSQITQKSVNDCENAKGEPKKVTLREARKEGYIPSVTTILGMLPKPGLEKWKLSQVAEAASEIPREGFLTDVEWMAAILKRAQENMTKARELGTEIHSRIDSWLQQGIPTPTCAYTEAARTALDSIVGHGYPYRVETTFAVKCDDAWVAGKCDLHYFGLKQLFDWKSSKEPCDGVKPMGYDEHVIQIASYQMALFGELREGSANIFLSTSIPGNFQIVPWTLEELGRGWQMYRFLFKLWCLQKNYNPS